MDFNDPYDGITIENLIYVSENIPTKETEDEFNEIFSEGCSCKEVCSMESNCSCIAKYGVNYIINKNDLIQDNYEKLQQTYTLNSDKSTLGIYECNDHCNCKHICGNKLVQYGPRNNLQIQNCSAKGLGLFTTDNIPKGGFICEYAGEVITKSEATKRYKFNEINNRMNYIICSREHFGENTTTTFIDPSYFGNIGRFLNHSCAPNCELVPVRVNNAIPKLCIFAKENIKPNSELTFDYGDGSTGETTGENDLKKCLCAQPNCREWMPYCANVDA